MSTPGTPTDPAALVAAIADGPSAIRALATCYTGVVHDVMRARGMADFTLPPALGPLDPARTLCGPAFTVAGRTAPPGTTADETLLAWTRLLSAAPPGHVWVCQPNTQEIALMGELSAETLHAKGLVGAVIDGGLRDCAFIQRLGWPVWRRFHTPRDVVGLWLPSAVNQAITIGTVTIEPGDVILADLDGVVRVPQADAVAIAQEAVTALHTENQVRAAIRAGIDPVEAYLTHRKF